MCFSASASFSTAGLLVLAALISYKKARSASLKRFAIIPLFFAIQQSMEGIVWITAPGTFAYRTASYLFLLFACAWPAILATLLWHIEPQKKRKKLLAWCSAAAVLFCVVAFGALIVYASRAQIGEHIDYSVDYELPISAEFTRTVYLILALLPPLISSVPAMWLLSLGIVMSLGAAYVWYPAYLPSVWCFFAAIMSALIILIVK